MSTGGAVGAASVAWGTAVFSTGSVLAAALVEGAAVPAGVRTWATGGAGVDAGVLLGAAVVVAGSACVEGGAEDGTASAKWVPSLLGTALAVRPFLTHLDNWL